MYTNSRQMLGGNDRTPDSSEPRHSSIMSGASSLMDSQVMLGELSSEALHNSRPRMLRIILASTSAEDFELERTVFWRDVMPEMQAHAANCNIELCVLDPFLTGEDQQQSSLDGHEFQMLLSELTDCAADSTGVFLISLVGDRYGPPVLPSHIESSHFIKIRSAAFTADKSLDVRLLDDWYEKDENIVPPSYCLQNEHNSKMINSKIRQKLLEIIVKGAEHDKKDTVPNQVLNKTKHELFYSSALDQLIQTALKASDSTRRILTVIRQFENLTLSSQNRLSSQTPHRFADSTWNGNGLDTIVSPASRLASLKNELSAHLTQTNCVNLQAVWSPSAAAQVDLAKWLQSKDKKAYLHLFMDRMLQSMRSIIDEAALNYSPYTLLPQNIETSQMDRMKREAVTEAYSHLRYSIAHRSNCLVGYNKQIEKLREQLTNLSKKGFVVHVMGGQSSGKSAVLSEVVHEVRSWMNKAGNKMTCLVCVRHVALTATSCYAHELWRSLCVQMCAAMSLDFSAYQTSLKTVDLAKFLSYCLGRMAEERTAVIICVDDIDLLKYSAHNQTPVIPDELPPNCAIVLSCTAGGTDAFNAPDWISDSMAKSSALVTIKLPNLTEAQLLEIANQPLAAAKRRLTSEQQAQALQLFVGHKSSKSGVEGLSTPLAAKLVSVELLRLRGTQSVAEKSILGSATFASLGTKKKSSAVPLAANVKSVNTELEGVVTAHLKKMEKLHGLDALTQICRYLTAAHPHGLTECELLSLLSVSDPLFVQNLLKRKKSPISLAFPHDLWMALRRSLDFLLTFVITDGCKVWHWRSAPIARVMRKRYLSNTADRKKIHEEMCKLFLNEYVSSSSSQEDFTHAGPDPVRLSSDNDNDVSGSDAVNYPVVQQPLRDDGLPNARVLRCLWYQLLHAGDIDRFKRRSLCHFPYVHQLVRAHGLPNLLSVFEDCRRQVLEFDIYYLYTSVLKPALRVLLLDQQQFPSEIIGRLRYTIGNNTDILNSMIEQAMTVVDNYHNSPVLVPLSCWIKPPLISLITSIKLSDWQTKSVPILQATHTHQHILVCGLQPTSGLIHMYHIASQKLLRQFNGHTDRVTCLAISSNSTMFVSGSRDNSIRIWDVATGTCTRTINAHKGHVTCVRLTKNDECIVTGSADSTAKLIEVKTGKVRQSFEGHTGAVTGVSLTTCGDWLVTGCGDFAVIVWNTETGEEMNRLGGLMAPVRCMLLTGNDAFLVVSCEDETLRVFSLVSGTELIELQSHEGKVHSMAVCQNDCQLFAGCDNGRTYTYDLHTGQVLNVLQSERFTTVTSLQVTADGRFVLGACGDTISIWCVTEVKHGVHQPLVGTGQMLLSSAPSLASPLVPVTVASVAELGHALKPIVAFAMTADQRYAACATESHVMALWDLEICQCVWTVGFEESHTIKMIEFSARSTKLLSGSVEGVICVWAMSNGALLHKYTGHNKNTAIVSLQVKSDENQVCSLDTAGNLHIWTITPIRDNDNERELPTIILSGFGAPLSLMPSGSELVALAADTQKEMRIWTMNEDRTMSVGKAKMGHSETITCVAISNNRLVMVTAAKDQSLKVWDLERAKLTQVTHFVWYIMNLNNKTTMTK